MVDSNRESELNAALELLFFGYRAFVAEPDRVLGGSGLQRVHHRILYFVGRNTGLSVGELVTILGVSKQALHAPLRELRERGLIEAPTAERDRRVKCLRLTDAGARLEGDLSGSQRRRLEGIFNDVGPEREAAWREIMAVLAGDLPVAARRCGSGQADEAES